MNEFVEECRREWKRLGVPDSVANEMVLGSGAFDARSFAAAWAAERGLVRRSLPGRGRLFAVIATSALIAIAGAVLVILASPAAAGRLTLPSPVGQQVGAVWVTRDVPPARWASGTWTVAAPLPAPGARIVTVTLKDSGVDTRAVGWVLLSVGLAGLVPLMVFRLALPAGLRQRNSW